MSLTDGQRLGPYEILSALGAGGMGEVYRARDTKLNRDVAIKVLLPQVANDPDRLARFSREAQVLASLNHPNIAQIHGLEEAHGITALVMELVEGEDLSQRIARGPIPIDEALPIARQIAEALEAAHDHGIIHRDLKPANIKVRPDGTVKVLDFGLAKAVDPSAGSSATAMNSPTLSIHATQAGLILGTAAYMSPEQASGKTVDRRSDLWSFGVVLLEMLTGRQAFAGETVSHVLAAVLKEDPDWTALPVDTPVAIRRLLRRCLEKDRRRRLPDAAAARLEIDDSVARVQDVATAAVSNRKHSRREFVAWGVAGLFALAVAVLAVRGLKRAPGETVATRFSLAPPDGWTFASMGSGRTGWGSPVVVSPDGRHIVLVAAGADGTQHLWLRALDATVPRLLEGTSGASGPFWSPDSRWIAFFSSGKLKRVEINGRDLQVLCDSGAGGGGTWNRDDVILFAPTSAGEGGLFKVPGGGGLPTPVTTLDASGNETNHLWPQFLPDGRHYLYVIGSRDEPGLYVGALDSPERTKLLGLQELGDEYSRVEYAASGHLLFVRNRALLAQPFNAAQLALTGSVTQIADNVLKEGPGSSAFSVSNNGVLVYWSGAVPPDTQLTWLKRDGSVVGTVGQPAGYLSLALSPDERWVAVSRFERNEKSLPIAIWLVDVERNSSAKLTFGMGSQNPVWSRDGVHVTFSSARQGPPSLFQKSSRDATPDASLFKSPTSSMPTDWSPDGTTLAFQMLDATTNLDLWLLPAAGTRTPTPFLRGPANETDGRISPDGRWIAYVSDESGRQEVYVTSFPAAGSKRSISTGGGHAPQWRRNGRELFYAAANGQLMAVPMLSTNDGSALEVGIPKMLFQIPTLPPAAGRYPSSHYAASGDGRRFLVRVLAGDVTVLPATVVLNWAMAVRK